MGKSGKKGPDARPLQESGEASVLIATLVTALKNIAIYPAAHPRVASAAKEFVAHLLTHCGHRRSSVLVVRGDEFLLDDDRLQLDGGTIDWLKGRFREAGLRGVEFASECAVEDVLAFATALNQARARSGTTFADNWTSPNQRVSALPLVYQGRHDANAGKEGAPAEDTELSAADYLTDKGKADARVRAVIDRMAGTADVQKRLRAIAAYSRDTLEGSKKLDLFEVISDLLPADVANDPSLVEDVVGRILCRVEDSMNELVRRKASVKGADLLRKAVGVARRFFNTSAPQQAMPASMPSGRPEDEKIVADLDLLLKEMAALPDASDLHLPDAAEMATASELVSREMFGICLHALANSDKPTAAEKLTMRLRKARASIVAEAADVLAAYAGPASDATAAGMATRQKVLDALIQAGHVQLVRDQHFVDATFVTRGFPEGLTFAARVLDDGGPGLAVLRAGLEGVATVLQAGGLAAAETSGVLAEPTVVKALAATGGKVADQLLVQAAGKAPPAVRAVLREVLAKRDLPVAEATVLLSYTDAEALPRDYLQSLLLASGNRRFDASLRAASGALLRRRAVLGSGHMSHEARLLAIGHLVHVPGPETEALLREIARAGRFLRFTPKARALRRSARVTLTAIQQERRK